MWKESIFGVKCFLFAVFAPEMSDKFITRYIKIDGYLINSIRWDCYEGWRVLIGDMSKQLD